MPYIAERTQGIVGASTVKDLETALQLVYGYFTDSIIFKGIIARTKAGLANKGNSPASVFQDTVSAVLGNHNFRRTAPSLDKLDQVNLTKAYKIYNERFADASAFTFTFVGNIDLSSIKPLLEKYLGSLPATYKKEQARNLDIHIPEGRITKTVYKGSEPKATVDLVFLGNFDCDQKKIQLNALKEVLEIRLLERLREGESGVYSPSVSVSISKYPLKRYGIDVSFGCSPQNADKLVASTLDEIDQLKADGPPQVNIDKFRAEDARNRDLSLKTNGFWQAYISGQLQNHDSIEDVTTYPDAVAQVTPESLKEAARKCLSGNNYLRLQLLPENAKP